MLKRSWLSSTAAALLLNGCVITTNGGDETSDSGETSTSVETTTQDPSDSGGDGDSSGGDGDTSAGDGDTSGGDGDTSGGDGDTSGGDGDTSGGDGDGDGSGGDGDGDAFPCNPLLQDCPTRGEACYLVANSMSTACAEPAQNAAGLLEDCQFINGCVAGATCFLNNEAMTGLACAAFCPVGSTVACAAGETCQEINAYYTDADWVPDGWGMCVPDGWGN